VVAVCTLILAWHITLVELPSDLHLQIGSRLEACVFAPQSAWQQAKHCISQCLGWWLLFSVFSQRKIGFRLNIFWERLLFAETFIGVYFSQFSPPLLLTFQPILITPTKNTDLSSWKRTPLGVFFTSYESLHEVAQTYVCVFNIFQNLADVTRSIMLQCRFFRCNSYFWKAFPCTKCGFAAGWSFARTI